MRKRIFSVLLAFSLIVTTGVSVNTVLVNADTVVSSNEVLSPTTSDSYLSVLNLGQLTKVDVSSIISDGYYLSSISFVPKPDERERFFNGEQYQYANADIDYDNGILSIRPTSVNGTIFGCCYFRSGDKELKFYVVCPVAGNASALKEFNGLYDIVDFCTLGNFRYDNVRLDLNFDGSTLSRLYICSSITNISNESLKPDIKVNFYDDNKQYLGYAKASDQIGSTIHKVLSTNENYPIFMCSADTSGLPNENVKKIAYWKIIGLNETEITTDIADKPSDDSTYYPDETLSETAPKDGYDGDTSELPVTSYNPNIEEIGSTKITKLVPKKKAFTVSFKSVKNATTYTIAYSYKDKNVKSDVKTKTVKKTSVIIKGLKKGKKYYVKVRPSNGSTWSKIKSVNVK